MSQIRGTDPTDLEALERQVLELRDALDDTECTAEAAEGLIQATVNGRGNVRGLRRTAASLVDKAIREGDLAAGQLADGWLDAQGSGSPRSCAS